MKRIEPSFKPFPITFNSKEEELRFNRWVLSDEMSEADKRNQKMLENFRELKKEIEEKRRNINSSVSYRTILDDCIESE